jgi:hypothetical protein
MKKSSHITYVIALLLSALVSFAGAHDDDLLPTTKPEKLGTVNFPVSCNDVAQREFNRAMALFHSFWWDAGKQSFAKVLELDPNCGMADWGIAWMSLGNPFTWPSNPNAAKAGAPTMADAVRIGAKTEREPAAHPALPPVADHLDQRFQVLAGRCRMVFPTMAVSSWPTLYQAGIIQCLQPLGEQGRRHLRDAALQAIEVARSELQVAQH